MERGTMAEQRDADGNEPLADMGYVYLFKALAEGSGIELGES